MITDERSMISIEMLHLCERNRRQKIYCGMGNKLLFGGIPVFFISRR